MKKIHVMISAESEVIRNEMMSLLEKTGKNIHYCSSIDETCDFCFAESTKECIQNMNLVKSQYSDVMIVFYAGDTLSAVQCFEAHPYDCLIQNEPNSIERLVHALNQIQRKNRVYVYSKNKTIAVIDCHNIMYFYKTLNDLNICAIDQEYIQRKSMKSLELPEEFCKISSSLIVNLDYVSSISDYRLTMKNGTHFQLSRQKSKEFRRAFQSYLKKGNPSVIFES